MKHATRRGRRTLPFAPLQAAIEEANRCRQRSLHGYLTEPQRRAYHAAARSGRVTFHVLDQLCDVYGWHPREIWTDGAWDELVTRKRTRTKVAA